MCNWQLLGREKLFHDHPPRKNVATRQDRTRDGPHTRRTRILPNCSVRRLQRENSKLYFSWMGQRCWYTPMVRYFLQWADSFVCIYYMYVVFMTSETRTEAHAFWRSSQTGIDQYSFPSQEVQRREKSLTLMNVGTMLMLPLVWSEMLLELFCLVLAEMSISDMLLTSDWVWKKAVWLISNDFICYKYN